MTHTIQKDEFGDVVVFDPKGQLVVGYNNAEEAKEDYPDAVEVEGVYHWPQHEDDCGGY